ncbi:MAG TPA: hypothetical protein PKD55_12825 [Bellilinea sp.]|nr:hypothetical protein [Bellilinea sp.]
MKAKKTHIRNVALIAALCLIMASLFIAPTKLAEASARYPSISVVAVEQDVSIVLRVENAPANEVFTVLIGKVNTKGLKGVPAGTFESGQGGTMELRVPIPEQMKKQGYLDVRIEGKRGYYAYNWFQNVTKNSVTATATPVVTVGTSIPTVGVQTPVPNKTPSKPIPVFDIIRVEKGKEIIIRTKDYPGNVDFTIRMGKGDTRGIDGYVAGTLNSGKGGTFEATIPIPAELKDTLVISVRLDGKGGWYSYNWFVNSTRDK